MGVTGSGEWGPVGEGAAGVLGPVGVFGESGILGTGGQKQSLCWSNFAGSGV